MVKKEQENRAVVSSEKESLKSENLIITESLTFEHSEVVAQSCSVKKVFLKISYNSQENTCARVSFLIKLEASALQLY